MGKAVGSKKEIVIVGGSYAGVLAAKTIFKKVDEKNIHVTLISPNAYIYFNVAAPRLVIRPSETERTLFSIKDILNGYSNSSTSFIQGEVISTKLEEKKLIVKTGQKNKWIDIKYQYLIIASGTNLGNDVIQNKFEGKELVSLIHRFNKEIHKAKSIIILGGGPTGVEIAGELGYEFGQCKNISLLTGKELPLTIMGEKKARIADSKLKNLNVKVTNAVKYKEIQKLSNGESQVLLEDGGVIKADLVINTTICNPNTRFLDEGFLDSKGYLKTDACFTLEDYPEVIGLGDVLSIGGRSLIDLYHYQLPIFEKYIEKNYMGKSWVRLSPYESPRQTMIIPISKSGGVGTLFGWGVPNIMVRFLKGRDYLIGQAKRLFY
ncbi:Piso0_001224 [Millerozyma farinosa CBS 7064]|uniref:Piso0_001224 protein n=1 Tax=Pichia sorbitophila (strain ATCC MYA-4447 / BCRC 22081 / CBS 7064 / NBRC 10061 / NRRL Y-12695) TaxID=559304 RepID=G8YDS7_PICSO|nr:Piso0_001224 [Millerozyma farinosa CBS 7064]